MLLDIFKSVVDELLLERILLLYHSKSIKSYNLCRLENEHYFIKALVKSSGIYGVSANLDISNGQITIDHYCTCSHSQNLLCEHAAVAIYKFLVDDFINLYLSSIKLIQTEGKISKEAKKIESKVKIFLNYAREDQDIVVDLYEKLIARGFNVWIDCRNILPGELWEQAIINAIKSADLFLACVSNNSINKRGMLQKELKNALSVWETKIDSDIYLIPVRLQSCEVPDCLQKFQWVNLFEETGLSSLIKALQARMEYKV